MGFERKGEYFSLLLKEGGTNLHFPEGRGNRGPIFFPGNTKRPIKVEKEK